jgi:hypothetical protein
VTGGDLYAGFINKTLHDEASGSDGCSFFPFFEVKNNSTVNFGKKGIILAAAHIFTGVDFSPFLADNDGSGRDLLASEPFNTQSLRV